MTDIVRWPSPPYRLSRNLGFNYVVSCAAAVVFAFGASLLLATDLYMATDAGAAHFKSSFDRWLPLVAMLGIAGLLYNMTFITLRSVTRRKTLAQQGATGRIVDVDILYAEGTGGRGGGVRYVYSYTLNDTIYTNSSNGLIAPLYLDGLQTRGAALVAGETSQLMFSNLYPLQVSDAEGAVVVADVENHVQRSMSGVAERLRMLEARCEGAARDYVHLSREIAAAALGRPRDALIWKRHRVARRLPRGDLHRLLRDSREFEFPTPVSSPASNVQSPRRVPIGLLATMIATSACGGAYLFHALYSGGQLSAGERGIVAPFGPHNPISGHDRPQASDPDAAVVRKMLRDAIEAKQALCREVGGENCLQPPADRSVR